MSPRNRLRVVVVGMFTLAWLLAVRAEPAGVANSEPAPTDGPLVARRDYSHPPGTVRGIIATPNAPRSTAMTPLGANIATVVTAAETLVRARPPAATAPAKDAADLQTAKLQALVDGEIGLTTTGNVSIVEVIDAAKANPRAGVNLAGLGKFIVVAKFAWQTPAVMSDRDKMLTIAITKDADIQTADLRRAIFSSKIPAKPTPDEKYNTNKEANERQAQIKKVENDRIEKLRRVRVDSGSSRPGQYVYLATNNTDVVFWMPGQVRTFSGTVEAAGIFIYPHDTTTLTTQNVPLTGQDLIPPGTQLPGENSSGVYVGLELLMRDTDPAARVRPLK